jgi:FMN phosphatase YigB (HAD superfamily)
MAALSAASQAMHCHGERAQRTNEQAFAAAFAPYLGRPWPELKAFFHRFYEDRLPELRDCTRPHPDARHTVQACLDAGYQVVIATNPLFPARAIEHRMEWAGVGDMPFALVTAYENMHTCKPSPAYYVEIAELLNVLPAACLMAGNDVRRDIAPAKEAGMVTFLVDEWLLNDDPQVQPDHRGKLADLIAWIEKTAMQMTNNEYQTTKQPERTQTL